MNDSNDTVQAREAERQRFIEEAWRLILDEEEETHQPQVAQIVFAELFMQYLCKELGMLLPYTLHTTIEQTLRKFFDQRLVPQVEDFARTPQEKNEIMATLAEKSFASLTRPFHGELLRQHIHEPQKLYGDAARRD